MDRSRKLVESAGRPASGPGGTGAFDAVDWAALVRELVRRLRGARTQAALSRALGYRGNVLFAWESGRDQVMTSAFFKLLRKLRRSPDEWLGAFGRGVPEPLERTEALANYLRQLAEGRPIGDLASHLGKSRYVVSRWLSGRTEISLADFFRFVELTTLGSLDLVALLVDPKLLPAAKETYERLEAARKSARERPWSHAIVHMVELPSYRKLAAHAPGWFASRLGITTTEEAECLDLLVRLGRLVRVGERYESAGSLAVDTRPDPDATRSLASFWMQEGARRVFTKGSGRFAFNTFGVSLGDLERLRELQARFFRELRAIVSDSTPTEAVVVATYQLFALATEKDGGGAEGSSGESARSTSTRRKD